MNKTTAVIVGYNKWMEYTKPCIEIEKITPGMTMNWDMYSTVIARR